MHEIEKITALDFESLEHLRKESLSEGYKFIDRLYEEWQLGINKFDRHGEGLFISISGQSVTGVCGLNRDPHTDDPSIGRLRRLYVAQAYRKRGIGAALVNKVLTEAKPHFRLLRLRSSPFADSFYIKMGFTRITADDKATHILDLAKIRT